MAEFRMRSLKCWAALWASRQVEPPFTFCQRATGSGTNLGRRNSCLASSSFACCVFGFCSGVLAYNVWSSEVFNGLLKGPRRHYLFTAIETVAVICCIVLVSFAGVVVGASYLSYKYIEAPCREWSRRILAVPRSSAASLELQVIS
jgi:hypothetical protein